MIPDRTLSVALVPFITLVGAISAERAVVDRRSANNPLITPATGPIGNNINGPTVIRAPDWLPDLGGRYLMYFAHHNGKAIRLAVAPEPDGPWRLHSHQVLPIDALRGSGFSGHIASPDIIVDDRQRRIVLFFHAPARWDGAYESRLRTKFGQLTGVASSTNGVDFALATDNALAFGYFRSFVWRGQLFGLTARALLFRGHTQSWPQGPEPFEERAKPLGSWRHCAVHLEGDRLFVFYTRWGDAPERIVASYVDLKKDWNSWTLSPPVPVLRPSGAGEGTDEPLRPSRKGAAKGPLHELRDPFVFVDRDASWLYYSIAGEQGISVARLVDNWQEAIIHNVSKGIVDDADATP